MSTMRDPVGPQPKQVYWRRRIVLLLGVLAVIAVVVLIVFRPGTPPTPVGTDAPAAGAPAAESSQPASSGPAVCDAAQVALVPVTDQDAYDPGVEPQLSWTLQNTGASPCTINVGTSQQVFEITSGDETIWSSADCQSDPADFPMTLEPGAEPVASSTIAWERTRSSADTCTAEQRDPVDAGGASYHLEISVGGIRSAETKQFLLN